MISFTATKNKSDMSLVEKPPRARSLCIGGHRRKYIYFIGIGIEADADLDSADRFVEAAKVEAEGRLEIDAGL